MTNAVTGVEAWNSGIPSNSGEQGDTGSGTRSSTGRPERDSSVAVPEDAVTGTSAPRIELIVSTGWFSAVCVMEGRTVPRR